MMRTRGLVRALAMAGTVSALSVCLAACGGGGSGADDGGSSGPATGGIKKVLAAAEKEGKVTWFIGSQKYTEAQQAKVSDAFEKEFGFPLEVTLLGRGAISAEFSKLVEESAAGVPPTIDLVNAGYSTLKVLGDSKNLTQTDWKDVGIPRDYVSADMPQAVYLFDQVRTPFYNTELVSAADRPKSWDDLLDPRWKGKIVTATTPSIWSTISYSLGEEKTRKLLRDLVEKQQMATLPTITAIPAAVSNGEYSIGIAAPIERNIARDEPLDYLQLDSKNVPIPNNVALLKDAPHPNAAAALVYFLSQTKAGQDVMFEVMGYSRGDVEGSASWDLYGEGRGTIPPYDWQVDDAVKLEEEFQKLLKQ